MMRNSFPWSLVLGAWLLSQLQPSFFVGQLRAEGQDPSPNPEQVARLKFMKDSTQVYQFTTVEKPAETLRVQPEPALRWTNPVSGLKDGTLFFWTSPEGRPYAAAQVFLIENGAWLHEFQSLTTSPFQVTRAGKSVWHPDKPGLEWKAVPGSSVAAQSAVQRLSQMKAIINRFSANDDFEGDSRWELRMLAKPLLRYSVPGQDIVDGATFAFVHTTDPEVFVMLEARTTNGEDPVWHYAIAPMTAYALKVSLDGKLVWEKPWLKEPFPQSAPYQILVYKL